MLEPAVANDLGRQGVDNEARPTHVVYTVFRFPRVTLRQILRLIWRYGPWEIFHPL